MMAIVNDSGGKLRVKKKVIFGFRGDPMCFIHVLLNGIDLHERGLGGEIVVEGDAVALLPKIAVTEHVLYPLLQKAQKLQIIHGACRACSIKLGVAEEIEKEGIALVGDMANHPSMGAFIAEGYDIITF